MYESKDDHQNYNNVKKTIIIGMITSTYNNNYTVILLAAIARMIITRITIVCNIYNKKDSNNDNSSDNDIRNDAGKDNDHIIDKEEEISFWMCICTQRKVIEKGR